MIAEHPPAIVEQAQPSPVKALVREVMAGFLPPPDLTVSQFADAELMVTSGPQANTHWRTDYAPYQRGILDAFHEPGVELVAVMGASQWGKTAVACNIVAYHIAYDPCPILVVEPTVDPMAKDFARNRLDPLIDASPRLLGCVSKKREKNATNTTLLKTFRGGFIAIGGANSAASLAARSIRLLVLDEVDRYPPELPGEGSTLAVAIKRTTAYGRRRRIFMPSSPTLKGGSIDVYFQRGDMRRYFVPCPSCGHMHPFTWGQVKWKNSDPSTARLHCPACDYAFGDAERVEILSRGEWRPTEICARDLDGAPCSRPIEEHVDEDPHGTEDGRCPGYEPRQRDQSIVSFHLWEAYSPMSSLADIVAGFLHARELQKAGDKAEMHTWQNTTLGEPVEPDRGEGVESHVLLMRREQYGHDAEGREIDVPEGACCLTMGVDTQDDRLEALVIGWGPGEESWFVDRVSLPGDTDVPVTEGPWKMLDEVLGHPYLHASGQRLSVRATCIDSAGHRTTRVYDYAARQAARRVYAIIGRDGQRPIVSSPSPRQWGREKRQVPLYTIGVDAAKSMVVSRLKIAERGPGYIHLPMVEWADEELALQLSSERLVTKFSKGVPVQYWQRIRRPNEALDCSVYALAALKLLNPDLYVEAQRLRDPVMPPPAPKPRPQRWIPPRRKGWLR